MHLSSAVAISHLHPRLSSWRRPPTPVERRHPSRYSHRSPPTAPSGIRPVPPSGIVRRLAGAVGGFVRLVAPGRHAPAARQSALSRQPFFCRCRRFDGPFIDRNPLKRDSQHVCVCVCVYVYIDMYLFIYIHIYQLTCIYIHIHIQ